MSTRKTLPFPKTPYPGAEETIRAEFKKTGKNLSEFSLKYPDYGHIDPAEEAEGLNPEIRK